MKRLYPCPSEVNLLLSCGSAALGNPWFWEMALTGARAAVVWRPVNPDDRQHVATRPSLIRQLQDVRNERAWEQFVEIYTPLIHGFCRHRGLQDADAADVAQEVMKALAQAMKTFEYDPLRGRFHNWLLTVVRSKLNNFFAKRVRQPQPAGATTLQVLADQDHAGATDVADWESQYRRWLIEWAAARIRPEFTESTWKAFCQTSLEARDGKEVAQALGMSIGAVYVAKSRVMARLREELRNVDEHSDELMGAAEGNPAGR